ncbi:MAG: MBL fold metallo-hydrolase, partial [Oscillospiraceae bacterium]|nr:MBL fold metallo-hydrolase [Oscillospiraceae bacterium]
MAFFTTLYSGSSGNCGVVWCGEKYLLIDMGKSCRTTLTALKSLGFGPAGLAGILITLAAAGAFLLLRGLYLKNPAVHRCLNK